MNRIAFKIRRLWLRIGRRLKANFYLYLAVLFTLAIIVDALFFNITSGMKQKSFDLMIKNRIMVSRPDPDIVIVDIDEASLAAMAGDYGRWPWPRQVMGEFLELIEQQHPKAVIFDVLFSDPDVFNPESDSYFNEAVASTDNTFFPLLRLDPASDHLSSLLPEQIPGATPVAGQESHDRPVAVVLPFLPAAQAGGRLGFHNIYPDEDGVARQYPVRHLVHGWQIPSLPARVVEWLGGELPERDAILLNWRGKPFTYRYVSFADLFFDMTSKHRQRPANEFAGKLVIVGSSAAGLFDIKPTPMERLHPGVEILATALDNLKHDDFLRVPDTTVVNLFLALIIIWTTAIAMYRNIGQEKFASFYGASQFLLIGVSYASINLMNIYLNLTGPVMIGLAYFSGARIYAMAARKILEKSVVMSSIAADGELYGAIMLIRFKGGGEFAGEKEVARIRRSLGRQGSQAKSVEVLKGGQKGIWGLLEGVIAVSWTCQAEDGPGQALILREAKTVEEISAQLWLADGGRPDAISFIFHQGRLAGGEQARAGWTMLFGEALMRWQKTERREA